MTYSLTERKRIRKSFAKRAIVQKVPFLHRDPARVLYRRSCRRTCRAGGAPQRGPAGGVHLDLPDRQPFAERAARVRQLLARRAAVRRQGVPAARPDLRQPAARQGAPGDHGQGSAQADHQGSEGAGGLHGRDPAHDHHRLVHHQRHRARHRLAAAPLAGRVLRARPRQDAFLRQAAVLGARHPVPRLLARLRVRPEGHRVLPRRPPPQDAGDDPAQGARLHAGADPRGVLRLRHASTSRTTGVEFEVVPERLRGEVARFDINDKAGKTIVAKDKRITVKHIRDMEAAGLKKHRRARRLHPRPHARAQRHQQGHRRDHRQRQRRDHRDAARASCAKPRSTRSRPCSPTTSTRARTSRRPCAPTRPPT